VKFQDWLERQPLPARICIESACVIAMVCIFLMGIALVVYVSGLAVGIN
jgi:hypothetical protein